MTPTLKERRTQVQTTTLCDRCSHPKHGKYDCIARVIDLSHQPVDRFCGCSGDRRKP